MDKRLYIVSITALLVAVVAAVLGCIIDYKLRRVHYCYVSVLWVLAALYSVTGIRDAKSGG